MNIFHNEIEEKNRAAVDRQPLIWYRAETVTYKQYFDICNRNDMCSIIPSLTVAEIKNRCIPCVYWGTAIFVVVMKYSNLFFSLAFFLDRSHFAFGYELIISSEAAGFMKIICNGFTLI